MAIFLCTDNTSPLEGYRAREALCAGRHAKWPEHFGKQFGGK